MAIGLLGAAGIAAGADLVSNGLNFIANERTNKANIAMQNSVNELNAKLAADANALSVAEAQKNREWQEYMSNTEIQRRMADMEAAGVNPLMAAGVSGASSTAAPQPYIAHAEASAAKAHAAHFDLKGISSAIQAASMLKSFAALSGDKNLLSKSSAVSSVIHDKAANSAAAVASSEKKIAKNIQYAYREKKTPEGDIYFEKYIL